MSTSIKLGEMEEDEFFLSEGELCVVLEKYGNYSTVQIIAKANGKRAKDGDGEARLPHNIKVNRVKFILN